MQALFMYMYIFMCIDTHQHFFLRRILNTLPSATISLHFGRASQTSAEPR